MRFQPFLCLALAGAFALPLSAHAAWPAGERGKFIENCEASAKQNIDPNKAKSYCDCTANVVAQKFNQKEIAELNSTTPPPTVELRDRLLKEVKVCNK